MNQKERLVEVLKKAPLCNRAFDLQYSDSTIEKVADNILADGWMRPPFTIGQTVYVVDRGNELYWKGTVVSFYHSWNEFEFGVSFDDGDFATYSQDCVFTSREDAEKALRKDEGK